MLYRFGCFQCQNEIEKVVNTQKGSQKATNQMSNLAKVRPKTHPGEQERSRCENVSKNGSSPGTKCEPFLIQIDKKYHPRNHTKQIGKPEHSGSAGALHAPSLV